MSGWLLLSVLLAPAAGINVSPTGDDAADGTVGRPVATLARAQALARQRVAAGLPSDLVVELAAGTYRLSAPLVFTAADAGGADHAVIWRAAAGATVVISGGQPVQGWRESGEQWIADVPAVGTWYPRQLLTNGRRATRARWPNAAAEQPYRRLLGAALAADRSRYTLTVAPAEAAAWEQVSDIEAVVCGNWEISRKRLAAVDPASGTLTLAPPHAGSHDAIRPAPGRFYFLENAREFLDQPGEWYLDRRTGRLTYWPRPGERLADLQAVLPRLTRLLEVAGTTAAPVRNLHFEGLRLAEADWDFPTFGFNGTQAAHMTYPKEGQSGWDWYPWQAVEPAVVWRWAQGCSFTGGALELLGGNGLWLRAGCRDNRIEGNLVRDIGCNGLMLGEDLSGWPWDKQDLPPGELPLRNRLANNLVTRCGLDDYGAVGIWVSFAEATAIVHNLVTDLPYSGISLGWKWDEGATAARDNEVRANHVHNVLRKLCDGGCLYTLGRQPGTVIAENHFHDALRSETAQGAPNNGIFFDQGSMGYRVERNVIHAVSAEPIRFNMCRPEWHTWADNQFGLPLSAPGLRGGALRCDDASSALEVPHRAALDPVELTAEAWVKVDRYVTAGDTRRWVINKNDDEWTDHHWALCTQGSKVGAYLNIGGGRSNCHELWSAEGLLTLGRWHHLALTYDGGELAVWIDGQAAARLVVGRPRTSGTLPLAIGRRQDAYNTFLGDIDEARLYSRALTAAELAARAASQGAPPPAGWPVVEHWSFDDLGQAGTAGEAIIAAAGLEPAWRARLDAAAAATR